jgi:hypothetical protein
MYNVSNLPHLARFISHSLREGGTNPAPNFTTDVSFDLDSPTIAGCAFVAAKSYYFGVGGGCRDFEAVVRGAGMLTCQR